MPKMSLVPLLILLLIWPPANPEQEVERGVETILVGLRSAEEESQVVIYLLALGNAMLPETIPSLLDFAEEGPAAVTAAAISALRRFPAQHISSEVGTEATKAWCSSSCSKPSHQGAEPQFAHCTLLIALSHQVKQAMRRIFHEKRKSYEKTCRLAAAEILLDNEPSPMDIVNILLAANELEVEMATFLLLKIQSSLHADHHPARWVWRARSNFPLDLHHLFFSSLQLWLLTQHDVKPASIPSWSSQNTASLLILPRGNKTWACGFGRYLGGQSCGSWDSARFVAAFISPSAQNKPSADIFFRAKQKL